jgi:hypothetical protein
MGALAYPDFVLGGTPLTGSTATMSPAPAASASLKPARSDVG